MAEPVFDKPLANLLAELGSDATQGLSEEEAGLRLERAGPNRLTPRPGKSMVRRFAEQLAQPLVLVLIGAAAISALLGDTADAVVITCVVLVNSIAGFLQEYRAEQAIAALDRLVMTEATVVRDGQRRRIPSEALVRGDVVIVASGDSVPADLRLLRTHELHIEEAALTGESVPVSKRVGELGADTVLGDRSNMAFTGTAVTFGQGCGLVVATGDATEMGRIAGMMSSSGNLATPLTRRIAQLSKVLLWIILCVAGVLFVLEAVRGAELAQTFNAAVALAVGAIPEGLPAAVTVLLAVGVQAMARRQALVRKLPAVETLGSTTVICSDKTGTLTRNEMTVTKLWTWSAVYQVTGVGYRTDGCFERDGRRVDPGVDSALGAALSVGVACNDSRIVRPADTTPGSDPSGDNVAAETSQDAEVEGDPTEAALLVAAEKAGIRPDSMPWRRVALIPFESQRMYMATLDVRDGEHIVHVKGSSDVLLERCRFALDAAGERVALDADRVQGAVEELARDGLRVLCLAQRQLAEAPDELTSADVDELTLVGLAAMIDPPRESAKRAVAACHDAGIRVKMITGDHAVTASAVAAQLGLVGEQSDDGRLRAVTGREIEGMDREVLGPLAERVAVFARVAPEQKLALVDALQRRGHVVAMTGDGVNDAPALEKADLGIAMGKTGTDVARGAAAMILTDDNFETIAAAVEEGRGVYDNLVKFVTWTLPTNGGEALVLLVSVVTGAALPILPVQILWVNMATAVLLGLTLVFEPKEAGLMKRPPRPVNAPLLSGRLGVRILAVSTLMAAAAFGLFEWALHDQQLDIEAARTIAVNTIVVVEVAYLFTCRSLRVPLWKLGVFGNPWVWLGATLMLVAQLGFTYLPFMNRFFHTQPLEWQWWAYFSVAGFTTLAAVEVYKLLRSNGSPRSNSGQLGHANG